MDTLLPHSIFATKTPFFAGVLDADLPGHRSNDRLLTASGWREGLLVVERSTVGGFLTVLLYLICGYPKHCRTGPGVTDTYVRLRNA